MNEWEDKDGMVPFDTRSIMLYSGFAFSQNGEPTIWDLKGDKIQRSQPNTHGK